MNGLLEHWKKLAPRDRKALGVCISFLAVVGLYLGVLEPLLDMYEEAVREKTDLSQAIEQALPKVQVLPLRMAQLKRAQAEYDYLLNRLSLTGPNAWSLSEVYHEIHIYATTTGVSIKDIRPLTRRKAGLLTGLPLEVSFQGAYKDIVKFIYYLETSPQVLVLTRLSLSGEKSPLSGTAVVSKVELPGIGKNLKFNCEDDLVVTVAPWDGFAPFEYAKRQGWLTTDSSHVEFYFSQYESTNFDMLIDRESDGTAAPILEMVQLLLKDVEVKITAPLAYYTVTEALLTAPGSDIKTVQDLRGKTIHLEKGGVEHYLLYTILKKNGMSLSDVRVADMDRMVVAQGLAAGLIEAGVTSAPFVARLVQSKEADILVSPKEWQTDILLFLLFREDALAVKKDAMRSLLRAYYHVAERWRNNPELAVDFLGGGEADDDLAQSIRQNIAYIRYLSPDEVRAIVCPRDSDASLDKLVNKYDEFLASSLGYEIEVSVEDLVDWTYAREVFDCAGPARNNTGPER